MPGVHVALVENGSGSEFVQFFESELARRGWLDAGWLSFRHVHPNLGFTGGNNVVLDSAFTSNDQLDYALLLNIDAFARPGAIRALIDFMDAHPQVGIAGSRLEDQDGTPQVSAFRFMGVRSELAKALQLGWVSKLLRNHLVYQPIPNDACPTDWVPGASMIIRRQVLEAIGTLDTGYYTYFDDIDFCLRARRAGFASWYVPQSRVVHLVGQTTNVTGGSKPRGRRPGYWFDARRRFLLKHHGAVKAAMCDAAFIIGFALWRLRRFIQRKPDTNPQYFLLDSIRHSVFCRGFKLNVVANPATGPDTDP